MPFRLRARKQKRVLTETRRSHLLFTCSAVWWYLVCIVPFRISECYSSSAVHQIIRRTFQVGSPSWSGWFSSHSQTNCSVCQLYTKARVKLNADSVNTFLYLYECCLIVSLCQPCGELATGPGCTLPSPAVSAGIGSSPSLGWNSRKLMEIKNTFWITVRSLLLTHSNILLILQRGGQSNMKWEIGATFLWFSHHSFIKNHNSWVTLPTADFLSCHYRLLNRYTSSGAHVPEY